MGLGYSTPEPIYAVRKSPNWGKNIFGPPVQLPTRPRRNYSYMSRKNNSRNTSSSPSFKLFVVRHGISCANVIKTQEWAYTFGARRSMYTDPELSSIGRKQAIENGPRLQFELRRRYGTTFDQMIIGSSNMLRAQQTAFLLTRSRSLPVILLFVKFEILSFMIPMCRRVEQNQASHILKNGSLKIIGS